MNPIQEELRDIIDGIYLEIRNAELSLMLFDTIADRKNIINDSGLGDLFKHLQDQLIRSIGLSLAKIYERSSKHQLRSIPAAIKFIRENQNNDKLKPEIDQIGDSFRVHGTNDRVHSLLGNSRA